MGFQQLSLTRAGGGISHARSRSAYPPMFKARDFPGGLDRFGMVYLVTIVITGEDLSRDEDICPLSTRRNYATRRGCLGYRTLPCRICEERGFRTRLANLCDCELSGQKLDRRVPARALLSRQSNRGPGFWRYNEKKSHKAPSANSRRSRASSLLATSRCTISTETILLTAP